MLVIDRSRDVFEHKIFSDITSYFKNGDLLVLNNSKVFPARLYGHKKDTGGKVEIFLLRKLNNNRWEALVKPGRRLKPGSVVELADKNIIANIGDRTEAGGRIIEFSSNGDLMTLIWRYGEIPLPPYINRDPEEKDKTTYQTIYAKNVGAVAAPTAGFHFTDEIFNELRKKGVKTAYLTLHPGLGTFRPITVQDASKHKMEEEFFSLPVETVEAVNEAKQQGGRVIAVGTTSVRALESSFEEDVNGVVANDGRYTGKFIYPPYYFNVIDCLLTNFHLPKSTLLLLVSALAGKKRIFAAYEEAIRLDYRFFSYGDAMLIL